MYIEYHQSQDGNGNGEDDSIPDRARASDGKVPSWGNTKLVVDKEVGPETCESKEHHTPFAAWFVGGSFEDLFSARPKWKDDQ